MIGLWPLTRSAGAVYISGVWVLLRATGTWSCTVFLYYTRGLMGWVGGVHCGDTGAMKAEGQARLKPPKNRGCA